VVFGCRGKDDHKIRHPRCVYNELDWSLYTCLTQLYGGIDMYNLLNCSLCHKLYISVPPYSCVRQVYKLQSSGKDVSKNGLCAILWLSFCFGLCFLR